MFRKGRTFVREGANSDRPAPLVTGEEGEGLRKRVWTELVVALETDVPRVNEVLRKLEVHYTPCPYITN